jgi:hypothetical protein
LEKCYERCSTNTEPLSNVTLTEVVDESSAFDLYCRDAEKLMIKISPEVYDMEGLPIYMLVVQESTGTFRDRLIYFVSNFYVPNLEFFLKESLFLRTLSRIKIRI